MLSLAVLSSCKKNEAPKPKQFSAVTGKVSQISPVGAVFSGRVTTPTGKMKEGWEAGVVRSASQSKASYSLDYREDYIPATSFSKNLSFSVYMGYLTSDRKFTVKSYLFDGKEYHYGNEVTFETPGMPLMEMLKATDISSTGVTLHARTHISQADFDNSSPAAIFLFYGFDSADKYYHSEEITAYPKDGIISARLNLPPGTYHMKAQLILNSWDFTSYPHQEVVIPAAD